MANGGKRPGSGRKPGIVSEQTKIIREMSQKHAEKALNTLIEILTDVSAKSSDRISAAKEILDRGFGKAPQAITDEDGNAKAFAINIFSDPRK